MDVQLNHCGSEIDLTGTQDITNEVICNQWSFSWIYITWDLLSINAVTNTIILNCVCTYTFLLWWYVHQSLPWDTIIGLVSSRACKGFSHLWRTARFLLKHALNCVITRPVFTTIDLCRLEPLEALNGYDSMWLPVLAWDWAETKQNCKIGHLVWHLATSSTLAKKAASLRMPYTPVHWRWP